MWSVTIIVLDQIGILIQYSIVLYSINWSKFIACIPIVCFSGCDVMNFQIDLIFLIKPFFYMTKKSRQKLKALRTKRALKVKKKHFSSFLKGFQLPKLSQVWPFSEHQSLKGQGFLLHTVWKVSKYGVSSGPYFPAKKTDQKKPRIWTLFMQCQCQ